MKIMKKLVASVALAAMLFSTSANAAQYQNTGGRGYEESRRAPSIAPAVALGAIALAAIIAIAVQNSSSDHGH